MKHQPSTCFQPYEKLLIGWIVGAVWLECQVCRDDEDETAAQHLSPTTASPCSQGGMGANGPVTISTMTTSKKGDGEWDEANTNTNSTSTSTTNAGQHDDRDKGETAMPMASDPSTTSNCL